MQGVTVEPAAPAVSQPARLAVSYEIIAYALLIALALVLRFAELDSVPLTAGEAQQALAAWRVVNPDAPGSDIIPSSPLLFALHGLSFSLFGATEGTARLWTAIGGALLVIAPLLFRDVLGRARTFLFSLILLFSPVLLAASRFDAPAIWALLCAVGGLWALRRWWGSTQSADALLAAGFFTGTVLLTDPAGFVLALILMGAGIITLAWARDDEPEDEPALEIRARFSRWPWGWTLLLAVLLVALVATCFMLYMPGLSSVSELLAQGVSGIVMPRAGALPLYPLVTELFYEPLVWLAGIIGVWWMARRGTFGTVDRFFAAWLILGGVATLLYRGAGPEHALWLSIPAAGLASWTFAQLLEDVDHPFLRVPWWSRWVLALGIVALLFILAVNAQGVGRSVLRTPQGSLLTLAQGYWEQVSLSLTGASAGQVVPVDPATIIWILIALALIILGGFMGATLWGAAATLRGGGLGLLLFALVTSLGSGWSAAVTNADNPAELWHPQATSRQTFLLRATLEELSRRDAASRGFPYVGIEVLAEDDGVIGWVLRDYVNARYIADAAEARTQPIALLPAMPEPPQLGGDYVGQEFVITHTWSPGSMQGFDVLAWWTQRRTRTPATPSQTMVLWLRQDVYNGTPFNPDMLN